MRRAARNLANDASKPAKNEYITGKLTENEGNPRKFWSQLKPLCKDTGPNDKEDIELNNTSTNTAFDADQVPDVFNKFFSNIGLELSHKVIKLNKPESDTLTASLNHDHDSAHYDQPPPFKFRETNDLELGELIKRSY